jgi:glycosyltransferase involved in cell wall biosynthesis
MLSVIVPVFNQLDWTKHIVREVEEKCGPCQLIVVDDGSGSETRGWLAGPRWFDVIQNEGVGVNAAWNTGVACAIGDTLLILNNDVVLTDTTVSDLSECLKTHKIACPWTTDGLDKFKLPTSRKSNDIAGWCFMMRKSDWVPVPEELDLWYGDTWQYAMAQKDVGWAGLVHHYGSKTLSDPAAMEQTKIRIAKDRYEWLRLKRLHQIQAHD